MSLLISIAGIVLTILFVVGTHEAGHFIMARSLGVKVLTFSIGFGKTLFSWRDKKGTEYVLALIPLGGYVRMLDETEGEVAKKDLPYAYNRQPFYKKFLIVSAGPLTNFICAIILYWLIFSIGFVTIKPIIGSVKPDSIASRAGLQAEQQITSINEEPTRTWMKILFRLLVHVGSNDQINMGVTDSTGKNPQNFTLNLTDWKMNNLKPDPLESIGITPYDLPIKLVIGQIAKDSSAAKSSLKTGDKLIAIEHKKINDWQEFSKLIQQHPDQSVTLTIEREGKSIDMPVTIGSQRNWLWHKTGKLGIAPTIDPIPPSMLLNIQYSPIAALPVAIQETYDLARFNILLMGKMLTGKLSLESLGGPITIFDSAGNSLNYGFLPFFSFLAFLSISIGIINILPIPGLDGGHLLIQLIESILGRPISETIITNMYRVGFLFLFFLILHSFINDIMRML